jgi:hypothetical protein
MDLTNPKDNKYLNRIRFESGYYPFTFNYNKEKNKALYNSAVLDNIDPKVLNLIFLGDHFHEKFHRVLSKEIALLHGSIHVTNKELKELFIAFLNEQELLNCIAENSFLDTTKHLTAFDLQNAVMIRKDLPNNPQNFTALSEAMIGFGNLFLGYLTFTSEKSTAEKPTEFKEKDLFQILGKILQVTNRYYVIKNHYDSCLYYNGSIEINKEDQIHFDSCQSKLHLYEQISVTCFENQRMNRYFYYEAIAKQNTGFKEWVLESSGSKILLNVSWQGGFVKYNLRKRTLDDYGVYLDYLRSVYDYYPFYSVKKLVKFKDLTSTDLLRLHSELKLLVEKLYYKDFPKENVNQIKQFKANFLPKIKHSVLKSYLIGVSKLNEGQIEIFIELLTSKNGGSQDLYKTPLLREGDYYYFPYLPLAKPNYLFLIDYWLGEAEESLDKRGKALEEYVKSEIRSVKSNGNNIFKLLEQSNFNVSEGQKQEIDLVIETQSTLIVGEIKCSKYPMYERDYYGILNDDVTKAIEQLNTKCQFLTTHKEHFKDLYTLDGKKIIKVIILNFPVFTGATIEKIPIIDINYFLSYFQSGQLVVRAHGENDTEEVDTIRYYTTEEEFCNNLESYLMEPPVVKMYSDQLKLQDCSYKLDGLPEIFFRDYNPINTESALFEHENKTPPDLR